MSRRFLAAMGGLCATIGLLFGLLLAGSLTPAPAVSAPASRPRLASARGANTRTAAPVIVSFADIAERLNPAVVNVDASSHRSPVPSRPLFPGHPDVVPPFDRSGEHGRNEAHRGTGTGFFIDSEGHLLTSHHIVASAERVTVRLADGRSFRARRIGVDPDTDIALLKVDATVPLPFAPLGDSDGLRVGEWVVAIGNPLAYEHTVTVGVVSFIGRKLFDTSLDRYIQTDAAINFGNSGGPLIDARGEVVGITSALSDRAPNIGFAVPINDAAAVLPQLLEKGRVSRGYIGVGPRDIDADLQHALQLRSATGALVQDVTAGSPGARAGIRIYDLVVAVDGTAVADSDQLVRMIAGRRPGTVATLQLIRDGRPMTVPVKLAERPLASSSADAVDTIERERPNPNASVVGLSVRELDREFALRAKLPEGIRGVIVSRVEPMGPAFDADIERGDLLLEVNRQPVRSVGEYQRAIAGARAGDVLTFHVYNPRNTQRTLQTVRIE